MIKELIVKVKILSSVVTTLCIHLNLLSSFDFEILYGGGRISKDAGFQRSLHLKYHSDNDKKVKNLNTHIYKAIIFYIRNK